MDDTEAGLLPGERLLWTGRPVRARVIQGDLIRLGLTLAALLVALAWGLPRGVAHTPGGSGYRVLVVAVALAALIATAVRVLRLKPGELRRTVYQVTDRRVLITTGTRNTWAAYLDQLAEPVVVPQRDGTADLMLRATEKLSLSRVANGRPSTREFTPGAQPFPVLRGLPDAEPARQVISTGRQRMLRGELDIPPVDVPSSSAECTGFAPAPGERVLWAGCPQATPWWFGTADITYSANFAFGVVVLGFAFVWARSTGAPLAPLTVFITVAALGFSYPAIGRVLRRRVRIKRSTYILTDMRLLTTWRAGSRLAGTQCALAQLLPPQVRGGSVLMSPAWPPPGGRRDSWAQLMWPAASTDPPQLVGLPAPQAVADLICCAQLAERARTWARRSA